jgi:hypothetical protein
MTARDWEREHHGNGHRSTQRSAPTHDHATPRSSMQWCPTHHSPKPGPPTAPTEAQCARVSNSSRLISLIYPRGQYDQRRHASFSLMGVAARAPLAGTDLDGFGLGRELSLLAAAQVQRPPAALVRTDCHALSGWHGATRFGSIRGAYHEGRPNNQRRGVGPSRDRSRRWRAIRHRCRLTVGRCRRDLGGVVQPDWQSRASRSVGRRDGAMR